MSVYKDYLKEIEARKDQGLHPKPIDGDELLSAIISQIRDTKNEHREDSLNFFYLQCIARYNRCCYCKG
jgi:aconitate hydratase 2/2-methylisocitrate dehydratase